MANAPALHTVSNCFRSPDQEKAFRSWDLPDLGIRLRALIVVAGVAALVFARGDYALFGMEAPFTWLLTSRILFASASLGLFLVIPKIERPGLFGLLAGAWTASLVAGALASNWTRPPDHLMHIGTDVLLILAIHAWLPHRWPMALVAGLAFSIGDVAVLHLVKTPAAAIATNAYYSSLAVANLLGFLMWRRLQISRRQVFHALTQEVRLRESLERSLTEVKVLRGILPICSQCKRVRDDDGFWHQVEVYFRDRAEVDFSHGLCPTCLPLFEEKLRVPRSFRIDLDRATVISRASGTLGAREITAIVESYALHADYRPEMDILWDLRDARFLIELEEVNALAEHFSTLGTRDTPHKGAFVVGDDLTEMVTRMFARVGPEHVVDYRTFEDLTEALEWLGLPPDYEP